MTANEKPATKRCPSCHGKGRQGAYHCTTCAAGSGQVQACAECGGAGLRPNPLATIGVSECHSCEGTGIGEAQARRVILQRRAREKEKAAERRGGGALAAQPQQQKPAADSRG